MFYIVSSHRSQPFLRRITQSDNELMTASFLIVRLLRHASWIIILRGRGSRGADLREECLRILSAVRSGCSDPDAKFSSFTDNFTGKHMTDRQTDFDRLYKDLRLTHSQPQLS